MGFRTQVEENVKPIKEAIRRISITVHTIYVCSYEVCQTFARIACMFLSNNSSMLLKRHNIFLTVGHRFNDVSISTLGHSEGSDLNKYKVYNNTIRP